MTTPQPPTAKPPSDLAPTPPSFPAKPLPPPEVDPLTAVAGAPILAALQAVDPYAYFERMLRTEPNLYYKWAALIFRTQGGSAKDSRNQTIVNVVSAIPRGPLDELPAGFEIHHD